MNLKPEKNSGLNGIRTHDVYDTEWFDTSAGRPLHQYRIGHGFENFCDTEWLDTSVGRPQHRYRIGYGFESRLGLNVFSCRLISQLLKLCAKLR